MTRMSEVGTYSRAFKNWAAMTRIYPSGAMPEDFVATVYARFSLPLHDPPDVVTAWYVFSRRIFLTGERLYGPGLGSEHRCGFDFRNALSNAKAGLCIETGRRHV